jgi:hypothetical protein
MRGVQLAEDIFFEPGKVAGISQVIDVRTGHGIHDLPPGRAGPTADVKFSRHFRLSRGSPILLPLIPKSGARNK